MEIYLVGGAVRDRLLGLPVVDRDWVVVGADEQTMLDNGYKPVGQDFPVFLHPDSHEEYALARTERKSGKGYRGFQVHAAPDVTLEQDLMRRDLTINAIAEAEDGSLIDPFGGQKDLKQRSLRHVSDAFSEDPVRILRVARFAARFANLGFSIERKTLLLMHTMVESGEADALVPERVWQELRAALVTESPTAFFSALKECGALRVILPELDALFGVEQPEEHHPEIDTGDHVMMVIERMRKMTDSPAAIFAALCHDLGKGLTPKHLLPSHHGHEEAGVPVVEQLCTRLRVPNDARDLAILTCRYHTHVHRAMELKASTLTKTLQALDCIRKPERFEQLLLACEADARGRKGFEDRKYPQADFYRAAARAFSGVDAGSIAKTVEDKSKVKQKIHQSRVAAIKQFQQTYPTA